MWPLSMSCHRSVEFWTPSKVLKPKSLNWSSSNIKLRVYGFLSGFRPACLPSSFKSNPNKFSASFIPLLDSGSPRS